MNDQPRWFAVFLALASASLTGTALAQQSMITAPDQIRACLCLEQSVSRQASDVAARRAAYEEKRRAVERLDREVATRKPQVNVNDPGAVAAFRQLLEQRDAAQQLLPNDASDFAARVERYNQLVADFNRRCAGNVYDSVALAQVRQGLVCPAE
jgi:hypothetical protein